MSTHDPYGTPEQPQGEAAGLPDLRGGDTQGPRGDEAAAAPPGPATSGAAQQDSAEALAALRAQLARVGIGRVLPTLAVAPVAYVAALIAAAVLEVLIVLAGVVGGAGGETSAYTEDLTGGTETEISGIAAILRTPFQLLALATFGSYGGSATVPLAGEVSASLRFLPFAVTLVLVLVAFLGASRLRRRYSAGGAAGIAITSLGGGLIAGLLVLIGARVTAQPIPLEEMLTVSVHAAGADAFFGATLLVGVALALGQLRGRERTGLWAVLAEAAAGIRLAVSHAVLVTVMVGAWLWLLWALRSILDGEPGAAFAPLLLVPVLLGQLLAYISGLSMLSSGSAALSGSVTEYLGDVGTPQRFWIGDLPWYAWLVALLLALVSTVLVSVVWYRGRDYALRGIAGLVTSWVVLPLGYLLVSLVLMVLGHARVGVSVANLGDGVASLSLAAWTPVLALLVAVVVEVLARFLAPVLAPVVPAVATRWFQRRTPAASVADLPGQPSGQGAPSGLAASAGWTTDTGQMAGTGPMAGTDQAATTAPIGYAPAPAPREPMSPRSRRRVVRGAIGAGLVLVLAVGAVVAYSVVSAVVYTPSRQVEAYLDAVQAGDYGAAAEAVPPNVSNPERVLLTDEIGAATEGGLTGYTIGEVERDGDTATVTATLDQDGVRTEQVFTLSRTGRSAGVFPAWEMDEVPYVSIDVYVPAEGGSLDVNGVAVDLSGIPREIDEEGFEKVVLPVLPGAYTITYTGTNEYLTMTPHELSIPVSAEGTEEGDYIVWRDAEINEDGEAAVEQELRSLLDTCAEQTVQDPEGCPFSAYVWSSEDVEGTWEITSYPTYTLEAYGEGSFYLSTDYGTGTAEFTYTDEDYFGEELEQTDTSTIDLSGFVTFPDEGGVELQFD